MNHNYGALYGNVRLRPLEKNDIEKLRMWRNDTVKTRFLRQIGEITPEMQEKWYMAYLSNPNEVFFAIDEVKELHRMVGSLALYDFNEHVAEIGKIQIGDPEANGRGIGKISLVMAMKIGFEQMGLKKIIASVHQENIAAHKNDISIGFRIVGQHVSVVGGYEDEIEIDAVRLKEINSYVSEIELI